MAMLSSVPVPSLAAAVPKTRVTPVASHRSHRSHRRASVRVQGQSKDALCRDMVGERREVESQGKVPDVRFDELAGRQQFIRVSRTEHPHQPQPEPSC
eukprot:338723-Pelagomonas_calceolata.AAC.11